MYNQDIKTKFLNGFEEQTQSVYQRIFKLSEKMEEEKGKDVFRFNKDELEELIKEYIKPKTKQSASTYLNVLSSYIQWTIDTENDGKPYNTNMFNPLRRRQGYFYDFVENQNDLYLSKGEIDAMISNLVNAQDAFIILALFNGIEGIKLSELVNLTADNINEEDGTIVVKGNEKKEDRIIHDSKLVELALMANKESEYHKKNGNVDYIENLKDVISLPESKYILKPTGTSKGRGKSAISCYSVYNRLEMIKTLEEFEEYNNDSLTTKNIVRSGMIYEAKKVLDNGGELDKKAIEGICRKFGKKYKWSMRDFLNEETIKDVYREDIMQVH